MYNFFHNNIADTTQQKVMKRLNCVTLAQFLSEARQAIMRNRRGYKNGDNWSIKLL